MFYVYIAFPCYFWQQFLVQFIPMVSFKVQAKRMEGQYLPAFFKGGMVIAALLGMVVCKPSSNLIQSSHTLTVLRQPTPTDLFGALDLS
jgi:dolichyl-phosphate-mannose--protein O-mannosyl transferase